MRAKEYAIKAELNQEYILYIGYVFGGYSVFVTNSDHTKNYMVYGAYKNIGTAANRLKKSAESYKSNAVKMWYTSKDILQKCGAFGLPE